MVCGIDYGSKLAGTTSICFIDKGKVEFIRSVKNQDADALILGFCESHRPELVAIDAPLSLPGVYHKMESFDDYFYRMCDKELKAMSPMFLGGLTARAMKLVSNLSDISFIEAYPVYRAKELGLTEHGYRSKTPKNRKMLERMGGVFETANVSSAHDLDALLCLEIGLRFSKGRAKAAGDEAEGLIHY